MERIEAGEFASRAADYVERAYRGESFRITRADGVIACLVPAPRRTIRDIRASLPHSQLKHFDTELADTDMDELPTVLTRWATLGNDGFEEFVLSTPFEGLEFGARSYDDEV